MDVSEVTAEQLKRLRDSIDEQETDTYSDDNLKGRIAAANGNVEEAAYYVWVTKAAALSSLVDITEGASQRKNSQAYKNAQMMADRFQHFVPASIITDPRRTSRTRAIERP